MILWVRIEAARLRRALEQATTLVAGQSDPIRIDIPKGSYVPVFASRVPVMIESNPVEGTLQTEKRAQIAPSLESLASRPQESAWRQTRTVKGD